MGTWWGQMAHNLGTCPAREPTVDVKVSIGSSPMEWLQPQPSLNCSTGERSHQGPGKSHQHPHIPVHSLTHGSNHSGTRLHLCHRWWSTSEISKSRWFWRLGLGSWGTFLLVWIRLIKIYNVPGQRVCEQMIYKADGSQLHRNCFTRS